MGPIATDAHRGTLVIPSVEVGAEVLDVEGELLVECKLKDHPLAVFIE